MSQIASDNVARGDPVTIRDEVLFGDAPGLHSRAEHILNPRNGETPHGLPGIALWLALALVSGAIVIASLIDIPRARKLGSMSWLGAITVAESLVGIAVILLTATYPKKLLVRLAPYVAFMLWVGMSLLWTNPKSEGLQNAAAYLLLLVMTAVGGIAAVLDRGKTERVIGVAMVAADLIALLLVLASLALRGWPTYTDSTEWIVHPRAVALFGIVTMAWHLAQWFFGNERALSFVFLWVAAIFVSLSRMATFIALAMVVGVTVLRLARNARSQGYGINRPSTTHIALLAILPVVVVAAVLTVPQFRNRLLVDSPLGASVEVRDNGRSIMWSVVFQSALEAPIIGKGLGTAESVVSDKYFWVGHPHNDYLRIFHDEGGVGLILLTFALLSWGWTLTRAFGQSESSRRRPPRLQLAALLALLGLMLGMLTDNSLVYAFVMGPTGILVGAGIGAQHREHQRRVRRKRAPSSPEMQDDLRTPEFPPILIDRGRSSGRE